jgi:hypothetical protein
MADCDFGEDSSLQSVEKITVFTESFQIIVQTSENEIKMIYKPLRNGAYKS